MSRSRYIVNCTENTLSNGDNSGQLADIATDNILAREVEAVTSQLAHKEEIIKMKDERIRDLEATMGWLKGEYAKLNDRLNALLLPPPKKSVWGKILRRKTAKVD